MDSKRIRRAGKASGTPNANDLRISGAKMLRRVATGSSVSTRRGSVPLDQDCRLFARLLRPRAMSPRVEDLTFYTLDSILLPHVNEKTTLT